MQRKIFVAKSENGFKNISKRWFGCHIIYQRQEKLKGNEKALMRSGI
jgi:hypothetical protein